MTHPSLARQHRAWHAARWVIWGGAALVLVFPLVAMRIPGAGVHWTASDFGAMAALLLLPCVAFELAVSRGRSPAYVSASLLAAGGVSLVTWVNLAVGVVGDPGERVNLVFFAAPAVAVVGACWSRLHADRLARVMVWTGVVQVLASGLALALENWLAAAAMAVFALPWLASARLFGRAAVAASQRKRCCIASQR